MRCVGLPGLRVGLLRGPLGGPKPLPWPLTRTFGARPLLLVSATMLAAGFAWLSSVDGFASLCTALLVLSAASGAYDVGANTLAMDYERITGLKRMASIHAAFSAGGAVGALFAGVLLSTGLGFRLVYFAALL